MYNRPVCPIKNPKIKKKWKMKKKGRKKTTPTKREVKWWITILHFYFWYLIVWNYQKRYFSFQVVFVSASVCLICNHSSFTDKCLNTLSRTIDSRNVDTLIGMSTIESYTTKMRAAIKSNANIFWKIKWQREIKVLHYNQPYLPYVLVI